MRSFPAQTVSRFVMLMLTSGPIDDVRQKQFARPRRYFPASRPRSTVSIAHNDENDDEFVNSDSARNALQMCVSFAVLIPRRDVPFTGIENTAVI